MIICNSPDCVAQYAEQMRQCPVCGCPTTATSESAPPLPEFSGMSSRPLVDVQGIRQPFNLFVRFLGLCLLLVALAQLAGLGVTICQSGIDDVTITTVARGFFSAFVGLMGLILAARGPLSGPQAGAGRLDGFRTMGAGSILALLGLIGIVLAGPRWLVIVFATVCSYWGLALVCLGMLDAISGRDLIAEMRTVSLTQSTTEFD